MAHWQRLRIHFSAILTLILVGAYAAPAFPPLTGRVVDQAALLDTVAEARIDAKLTELEAKTSTQLVVVTLHSLGGYDISDYGYQLGRAWGVGQKGKNNGMLLIVVPTERKVRIEVGYGLEGLLTDAVSRLIISNAILPRFRAGDFPGGIERGVDDIIQVLSGDAEDFKRRAAEHASRPSGAEGMSSFTFVLIMLAIWFLFFLRRSRAQQRARSRRSGWWFPPVWPADRCGGVPMQCLVHLTLALHLPPPGEFRGELSEHRRRPRRVKKQNPGEYRAAFFALARRSCMRDPRLLTAPPGPWEINAPIARRRR